MVPTRPNKLARRMLRVKGSASSAVAVSDENLFKTLPAEGIGRSGSAPMARKGSSVVFHEHKGDLLVMTSSCCVYPTEMNLMNSSPEQVP